MRRDDAGTTLVELLVAIALLGLVLSVLATLTGPVLAGFDADPAAADAQQRGRSLTQALLDDVQRAGSGFVLGLSDGPGVALPAVVPDQVPAGGGSVQARPELFTTWRARRASAHGVVRTAVVAGDVVVPLSRPALCPAASATCGFAADDDILLFAPHGRMLFGTIRGVLPPFDLLLSTPLPDSLPVGAIVAAIVTHTYELRPDAVTGLSQVVRRLGTGPATPVIDFVRRFDLEWVGGGGAPHLPVAPDSSEMRATAGPSPPPAGIIAEAGWPGGENCAYFRDAAGAAHWRGSAGSAVPIAVSLATLADGPWCPSPGSATRWDADLSRVVALRMVFTVAVATASLRPEPGFGLARPGGRVVPDLVIDTTARVGRHGAGGGT